MDSPLEVSKGCLAFCSPGHPDELNFVFGGTATFNFNIDGKVFSSSLVLRFGQGHRSRENNWWIGNEQCFRADTADGSGLVCGPLFFIEDTNVLDKHQANLFKVAYLKRSFQSNSCLSEGSGGDKNVASFIAKDASVSLDFLFKPTWYAVTAGQPVPADCLEVDEGGIIFTAGRSKSSGPANLFMQGNSEKSILRDDYTTKGASGLAAQCLDPNFYSSWATAQVLPLS